MHTVILPSKASKEYINTLLASPFWRQSRAHVQAYLDLRRAVRESKGELTARLDSWRLFQAAAAMHELKPIEACDDFAAILVQIPDPEPVEPKLPQQPTKNGAARRKEA